ncbi:hypothetical protein [Methylomonas sp. AM2-LC]|uniref:hypothetical protein n=1 Tax=Methylomonas sp. AM2-LC TaxID=3153301 RepID=UPI003267C07D
MSCIWEWVPNFSLGIIKLGDQIASYIDTLHLLDDDDEDDGHATDLVGYKIPNVEIYIYVDNESIISITSYEEFIYKDKNIIGMSVNQLSEILGCEPSEIGTSVLFDNGEIQTPFEYFHLGLQLWVSNEIVASASIMNGLLES